jgi:hypothetical protein
VRHCLKNKNKEEEREKEKKEMGYRNTIQPPGNHKNVSFLNDN